MTKLKQKTDFDKAVAGGIELFKTKTGTEPTRIRIPSNLKVPLNLQYGRTPKVIMGLKVQWFESKKNEFFIEAD